MHKGVRGSELMSLAGPVRKAASPWPVLLTLPLSTISFCRLVEVITRSRMACQDQHVTLQVVPAQSLPGGHPPTALTFMRSVQELRILGKYRKRRQLCSVAL